jgi:hypothetical protein
VIPPPVLLTTLQFETADFGPARMPMPPQEWTATRSITQPPPAWVSIPFPDQERM